MSSLKTCSLVGLLFLAIVFPLSLVQEEAADAEKLDHDWSDVVWYNVNHPLVLNCNSLGAANTASVLKWYKHDIEVSRLPELVGRAQVLDNGALLEFRTALEDDFGNYTCRTDNGTELRLSVRGLPRVYMPTDTEVVEGHKLKLVCRVVGKPRPRVTWSYRNHADTLGESSELVEDGRVQLQDSKQGVLDGELVLNSAEQTDAGKYICCAGNKTSSTIVRVKDKYAALWPFLGICAEVLVLCVIIFVYERRRKHNL